VPTKFDGTDEERLALDVFIKLHRACASVDRQVNAPLREAGLTPIQFGVLDTLIHAGPLPISTIAAKNLCSQNSLSTVIDTLERQRLVQRTRDEKDRRVVTISLTESGRIAYESVWPEHLASIVEAISRLEPAEQQTLNDLLRKLGRGQ
jgi:MarR family 2-MHQ and catechol resistance regulon transcriptional repressor